MVLRIPDPSLVVLCGPAASGKTTFARRHFRNTAVVSSDGCRAILADDESNLGVSRDAFDLFHQIIETRLRYHRLTVADSTALNPEARQSLRQIARRRDVPAVALLFDVPEKTCIGWDQSRSRQVGRIVIHRQWDRFQRVLRTISQEGFAQLYILGQAEVAQARVETVHETRAGGV